MKEVHRIFKQTSADGSERFCAAVEYTGKWFFGLFNYTDCFFVHQNSSGNLYLYESELLCHWFDSMEDAQKGIVEALERKRKSDLHNKIVSFEQIHERIVAK